MDVIDRAGFVNLDNIRFDDPRPVHYYIFFHTTLYDYHQIDPAWPLFAYLAESGLMYSPPDKDGTTDWASTPPCFWWIPAMRPARFKYGATIHDQGYRHHWLWVSYDKGATWRQQAVTQAFMDSLLEEMIRNDPDPGSALEQWTYYKGVRLGSFLQWGNGDTQEQMDKAAQADTMCHMDVRAASCVQY